MFPADFSRDAIEWRKGINSTPFNLEIGCNSDRIDNAKIVTTKQAALIKWKKHSTNGWSENRQTSSEITGTKQGKDREAR